VRIFGTARIRDDIEGNGETICGVSTLSDDGGGAWAGLQPSGVLAGRGATFVGDSGRSALRRADSL